MRRAFIIVSLVALLDDSGDCCRGRQRRRCVGERRLRLQRRGGRQLVRHRPVHVERPDQGGRQRQGPVRLHAGTRRRRTVGERPADLRVHRGRPRLGRRRDRGELAREPRRSRDVVPGAGQRRGLERAAGHVVDPRRGRCAGRTAVLRSTIRPCASRSSSARGTCRFEARPAPDGNRADAGPVPVRRAPARDSAGRDAVMALEGAREVTLVGEAGVERDARDRVVAGRHRNGGPFESQRPRVGGDAHAVGPSERPGDVRRVAPDGCAELVERRDARRRVVQPIENRVEPTRIAVAAARVRSPGAREELEGKPFERERRSTHRGIRAPSRSASREAPTPRPPPSCTRAEIGEQALSVLPGGPEDDDLTAVAGEDARVGCPCGYRHEAPARQRRARAGGRSCGRRRR